MMPEGISLCTLASGSKGNAIYISDGCTRLLVDAGVSAREIERRMGQRGLAPGELDGLLVSHEHSDHIRGVSVLSRRYKLPVYLTKGTRLAAGRLGELYDTRVFECGTGFQVNSLSIHPFSISHDARDPAGFAVASNGRRIGIATDLGRASAMVAHHLSACELIVLEANHDERMLEQGPYPWYLKQRIRSRSGHLSNLESKNLLAHIHHADLQYVVLAHLSETNNTPEKALADVTPAIADSRTKIIVASQQSPGPILRV